MDHTTKMAFNPFAECADDSDMNVLRLNQSVLRLNIAIIHDFALMAWQVLLCGGTTTETNKNGPVSRTVKTA